MYATDNYPRHASMSSWFRDDMRRFFRRLRTRFVG